MIFAFLRTDPVRPFISGHVANSMAAEVIALLHSLLMAPESNAAQIWTTTAEKVKSEVFRFVLSSYDLTDMYGISQDDISFSWLVDH